MIKTLAAIAALTLVAAPLAAGGNRQAMASGKAGGAAYSRTIVEAAARSSDHTTLVAAVQAAGLVETLSGAGPFTVFAPTNAAFARLPAGTVETLLRPESRSALQSVLTYHVVPGRVTAGDLIGMIRKGRGEARVTTVQGGILTGRLAGKQVVLIDGKGGTARVSKADLIQSNGVIHVTDAVSLPR